MLLSCIPAIIPVNIVCKIKDWHKVKTDFAGFLELIKNESRTSSRKAKDATLLKGFTTSRTNAYENRKTVRGHPFTTYAKFSEKLTWERGGGGGVGSVSFSESFAYVLNE